MKGFIVGVVAKLGISKVVKMKMIMKRRANLPIDIVVDVDAVRPFGLLQNTTNRHQLSHDVLEDFGDGHSTRRKPRVLVATTV